MLQGVENSILVACCYLPQRICGQGYVFTHVCDSVNRGVSGESPGPRRPPGTKENPPGTRHTPPWTKENPPWDQGDTPPGPRRTPPGPGRPPLGPRRNPPGTKEYPPRDQGEPPPQEEHCSIRSMSCRYASYWNAFLLKLLL